MASAILNAAPGNEKFRPSLRAVQLSQNTAEINITKFPDTVKASAGLNTVPDNKAIHTSQFQVNYLSGSFGLVSVHTVG
jgi:hypothetical protein